jgi:hypothetical protein
MSGVRGSDVVKVAYLEAAEHARFLFLLPVLAVCLQVTRVLIYPELAEDFLFHLHTFALALLAFSVGRLLVSRECGLTTARELVRAMRSETAAPEESVLRSLLSLLGMILIFLALWVVSSSYIGLLGANPAAAKGLLILVTFMLAILAIVLTPFAASYRRKTFKSLQGEADASFDCFIRELVRDIESGRNR